MSENDIIDKWSKIFGFSEHPRKRSISMACEMVSKFLMETSTNINNIDTLIFPVIVGIYSSIDVTDNEIGEQVFTIHKNFVKYLEENYPFEGDDAEALNLFVVTYINEKKNKK